MIKPYRNCSKEEKLEFYTRNQPDVAVELYDYIKEHHKFHVEEPEYFIWHVGDNYMVSYSRKSQYLECYYQGFGHQRVVVSVTQFWTLKQLLKHIQKHKL